MGSRRAQADAREIRIRMYRVGFGDCFLLSLPSGAGRDRHMLFDCGVHPAGDIGKLEDVVRSIATETDRTLDLIVASHAHEDHIGGFGRHGELFRDFEIGEIWLPWTENLVDTLAIRWRRQRAAMFAMLDDHFKASPPSAAAAAALENVGFSRNRRSLDNLRDGFGTSAVVRYVEAGNLFPAALGIPSLSLRVLGPPRQEEFLKRMNPPKGERFLRLGASGLPEEANAVDPFPLGEVATDDDDGPRLSNVEARRFRETVASSLEGLAFVLDRALNNSSVVVLVSYLGRNLLFPGDAQFGAWQHWTDGPDGEEILAGLDFYKVSHHGSENATPRSALEHMTAGSVAAMVSTQSKPWESIPYAKLMDALEARTGARMVRSDSLMLSGAPVGQVLERLPAGFTAGPLWYDLTIPV